MIASLLTLTLLILPAGDNFDEIDPVAAKVDVPALIHVRTDKDVAAVRQRLIAFIWKKEGKLPASADVVRKEIEVPRVVAGAAATCETLTISMDLGFKAVVYHLRPAKPNGRLAIFHQGHADLWTGGAVETTRFFLDRGYAVLDFQMPLLGDNKALAPPGLNNHDDMAKLATPELEPIKFFLEPIAVALNHALAAHHYDDVIMVGLSGGGWTTTLYAAIDPRVRVSFPVAGTLPDYLRIRDAGRDRGDWEQYHPPLYAIANYLDLYVLGSHGNNRRQRQILNKYDSCCFAGVGYRTYEKHLAKVVADAGPGHFDVFLDDSHRDHKVSDPILKNAIAPLLDPRPR